MPARAREPTRCVITANVGGFDGPRTLAEQDVVHDFLAYTEENLPVPLPNLDARLRAKYVKMQSHRFLPHDVHVWIDGNVEITSAGFVASITAPLAHADVAICLHPRRASPYEEIDFILERLAAGDPWLTERYRSEPLRKERDLFRAEGLPEDTPLYACRLFARRKDPKVDACFDEWWRLCIEYSRADQAKFSYVTWKHRLRVATLEFREARRRWFRVHPHRDGTGAAATTGGP